MATQPNLITLTFMRLQDGTYAAAIDMVEGVTSIPMEAPTLDDVIDKVSDDPRWVAFADAEAGA